jgi:uncharacterized protein
MNERLRKILQELRQGLEVLYGERLERLILFGSQARGDAEPDSDIDVMVVLKGEVNPYREIKRAGDISADVSLKHTVVISCVYVSAERYQRRDRSLIRNVYREGIPL